MININRTRVWLQGIDEDPSRPKAATSSLAVQNLQNYQSFSDKCISGMDCIGEFYEVAAFRRVSGSGLTKWLWLLTPDIIIHHYSEIGSSNCPFFAQ